MFNFLFDRADGHDVLCTRRRRLGDTWTGGSQCDKGCSRYIVDAGITVRLVVEEYFNGRVRAGMESATSPWPPSRIHAVSRCQSSGVRTAPETP